MEYCRAITTKELLCRKKVCENSAFCIYHQPNGSANKFRYSFEPSEILLPEEMINHIYKMYFTNHVLKELANYDPQGDFSNIDVNLHPFLNISFLTRDYEIIRKYKLWSLFRRTQLAGNKRDYTLFTPFFNSYYSGFNSFRINHNTLIVNMGIFEYIANNGWFKYIMN